MSKLLTNGGITGLLLLSISLVIIGCGPTSLVATQATAPQTLILRSTPENLLRGFIPAGMMPALRIQSGQVVQIETFSHHGFVDDPAAFFKNYGISADMILPDLIVAVKKHPRPKDGAPHVLTGPIYVDGAEAGDTLEVRILDLKPRVPYGGNGSGAHGGRLRA